MRSVARFTSLTGFVMSVAVCSVLTARGTSDPVQASGMQGGLVVQLGCADIQLLTELHVNDAFLVHGLDTDSKRVDAAREQIRSTGLGTKVSAQVFDGQHLPYADNLVNLLIISDRDCQVSEQEINRVLCPDGTALARSDDGERWIASVKPRPKTLDDWTHYLHGPGNNAVSQDTEVGPPQHFQWISEPRFSRSHDHMASVTSMVSAGGRLFSIIDFGSIAFAGSSPRWRLVAQDAFNGIRLWERDIPNWEYHLRDFRSGPADIARRLVAVGDRVYVMLGYGQPVVALDAATGKTLLTYEGTEGAQEILRYEDSLLMVLGEPDTDWKSEEAKDIVSQEGYRPPFENDTPPPRKMRVMNLDAESGEMVWEVASAATRQLMPSTLAAADGQVYFQNLDSVVSLDARTGETCWTAPRPIQRQRLAWSTPTLVVQDGIVYSADRRAAKTDGDLLWMPSGGYHQYIQGDEVDGELIAYDAETGKRLWGCPAYEGFNAPVDILLADGLLWTGRYAWGNDPGFTAGRDPKTGEIKRERPSDQEFVGRMGHARCHRFKATPKYIISGRRGIEWVDLETGDMLANFWVRGICQYGVMPANGLVYAPPHSCACSSSDMLKSGFMALAPAAKHGSDESLPARSKLEKGPAFASSGGQQKPADPSAWPTYRRDGSRSGATSIDIPGDLTSAWATDLGGRLTSPVIAGGMVFVAEIDKHYVHAMDAKTGRLKWTFTAGARVDSPPTVDGDRVLFGSADGWLYCLRLMDGELVWRFRATSQERLIVADGQLESSWPVSGSVLVLDGQVYFTAGRTTYLDNGMYLGKLNATTGQPLKIVHLLADPKKRDSGGASGGHLPDILTSDGESIFLRSARFDRNLERMKDNVPHLWSSVGFLDHNWWHRTYWQYGTFMNSGWGGWAKAGQQVPAGRLLVTDGTRIFGFGRNQYDTPGAHVGVDADGVWGPIGRSQGRWTYYRLFGQALDKQQGSQTRREATEAVVDPSAWTQRIAIMGTGMLLAGETLYIAGPVAPADQTPHEPLGSDPLAAALDVTDGGRLLAVSAKDGSLREEIQLTSAPVFDGMAAADGRLYLSTKAGRVICLGSR